MSAAQVKLTLAQEADLLGQMITFVESVKIGSITPQAQFIQDSWARFLGERKKSNETLTAVADEDLLKDLGGELSQVQLYIGVTRTHPDYTEDWEKFLTCERDILERLIRRINDEKYAE